MNTQRYSAPVKGLGDGLSIEDQVTGIMASRWRELAEEHWHSVFATPRTRNRAIEMLSDMLIANPRMKTVVSSLLAKDRAHQSTKNAESAFFRTAVWKEEDLSRSTFNAAIPNLPQDGPITLVIDVVCLRKSRTLGKTGTKSEDGLTQWCHDPSLPACITPRVQWGYKMLHAGLILAKDGGEKTDLVTLAFEAMPAPLGPRKGIPVRKSRTVDAATKTICTVREWMDTAGLFDRELLVVVGPSFYEPSLLTGLPSRTSVTCRVRKDVVLAFPAKERSIGSCFYGERVRGFAAAFDKVEIPRVTADLYVGSEFRTFRYRVLPSVYLPTVTRQTPLKAMVLDSYTSYSNRNHHYMQPEFILTTDHTTPPAFLLQAYLDRMAIKRANRNLTFILGPDSPQPKTTKSIRRLHVAIAAAWGLLQITTHQVRRELTRMDS